MHIKQRRWWMIGGGIAAAFLASIIGMLIWYQLQLRPVDAANTERIAITIQPGATPDQIAHELKERTLIRSSLAFSIHAKLSRLAGGLQAGVHRISPSQSTPQITQQLQKAENSDIAVQFLPGAMLRDNSPASSDTKQDIRSTLERLGYGRDEIERAFAADYSDYTATLFKGRPSSAGVEGYVWGETYYVSPDATVEQILRRSFDEYLKQIRAHDLEAKFQQQGLTLFQGITLASIVQREVSCHGTGVCRDQKQVAQVFLRRMREGMQLGSDVTFIYAATQDGKAPTVNYDSPYNTRVHTGLPPGPISNPGLGALMAVAEPAEGDYLYFVSGDDGTTHFSHTEEEHVAATKQYCIKNCELPE